MSKESIKDEAGGLVERTPQNLTRDERMYEICLRQLIEVGLADSKAGKTLDVIEVRKKFGLPS